MEKVKSCGFLIYRTQPEKAFLLMRHPHRWDLPKGHVDDGETNLQCALRELEEETGIQQHQLRIEEGFKHKNRYIITTKRGVQKKKKLIMFLAELVEEVEIVLTEHESYQWVTWNPPHAIQEKTIDPLLAEVEAWWQDASVPVDSE